LLPLPTNRLPLDRLRRWRALALCFGLICAAPLAAFAQSAPPVRSAPALKASADAPVPNAVAKAPIAKPEPAPAPGSPRRISTLPPEKRSLAEAAPYRRFLWVTRWDYRRPEDLTRIFRLAAQARFSDVFFQVRGEGTVFYKTDLEPWAWELSGRGVAGTGTDPG
jgi:hypothetical protein